jgi:SAM-dependent methyltransferase
MIDRWLRADTIGCRIGEGSQVRLIAMNAQARHTTVPGRWEGAVKNYEPVMSFGEDTAKRYDNVERGDEVEAVAWLEQMAKGGPALELAIGTGRIALPLAARGIRVDGIDLSTAMVAQLSTKPGGADIDVTMGDFADVAVPGKYRLIYVVFNTLFNLLTQDEQVRCFENVADHLTDDGVFVVEAYVPAFLHRLRDNQYVEAEAIEVGEVKLDVLRHDMSTQIIEESHVSLSPAGVRMNPIVQRYAWPAELDLMARIAGLRLKERWAGWNRGPFTSDSDNLVSVYGR